MFPTILMATNDVRKRDPDIERILINNETIAVNQDPWGLPAFRIRSQQDGPVGKQWGRHLANGDVAALVLNRENISANAVLAFSDFLPGTGGGAWSVRDLQAKNDLGVHCEKISFLALAPHGTAFVQLTQVNSSCTAPAPPAPAPRTCAGGPPPSHQCRACEHPAQPCAFPVPQLAPCPANFTSHSSGYWSNPDQGSPGIPGKTIAECGAICAAKLACKGFEVSRI